jgi:hypothetical protein
VACYKTINIQKTMERWFTPTFANTFTPEKGTVKKADSCA